MQEAIAKECAGLRWGDFKPRLADSIVAHLAPVQERYEEVTRDPSVLEQVLPWGVFMSQCVACSGTSRLGHAHDDGCPWDDRTSTTPAGLCAPSPEHAREGETKHGPGSWPAWALVRWKHPDVGCCRVQLTGPGLC